MDTERLQTTTDSSRKKKSRYYEVYISKVLKNLSRIKEATKAGLKRYFAHKRDLGMKDRKDITFGIAFKKWVKTL